MRILVVCQRYWPEQFQVTSICEGLAQRGHDVTVVTGLPNVGVPGSKQGELLGGYERGRNRRQVHNGVDIIRVAEIPRKSGLCHRVLNYYSFWKRAVRLTRNLDDSFDVVVSYQLSPGMMGIPAMAYAEKNDKPFVLYCCDLWPESLKAGFGEHFGCVINHYGRVCRQMYQAADVLIMQSPAFEDYFTNYHQVPLEKLVYVPQFSTDEPRVAAPCEPHLDVNIVFMGNMGKVQGVRLMLEAMKLVCVTRGDVRMHFVGDGVMLDDSVRYVEVNGLTDNVLFHGRKSFEELPYYYGIADACILALDDSNAIGLTLPAKLTGYMANGKPVIAAAGGGVRKVVEDAMCGYAVPYGSPKALAIAICQFADDRGLWGAMSENALTYFAENFTKEKYLDSLEGCLVEAIKKHGMERK